MLGMSAVKIGNMALAHVSADSEIESFTTDKTEAARQCNLWYDTSRVALLEAFDWSFARRRATLSLHSEAAPDPWTYRYSLPSSCVYPRRIWNPLGDDEDPVPYEVESETAGANPTLLTDMEDAILIYTFDVTAPILFSQHFVLTLSHLLAFHIAPALAKKREIRADEWKIYQGLLASASANDANKMKKAPPRDAIWIRGR